MNIISNHLVKASEVGRAICVEDSAKLCKDFPPNTLLWEVTFKFNESDRYVNANYFVHEDNAKAFIRSNGGDPDAM